MSNNGKARRVSPKPSQQRSSPGSGEVVPAPDMRSNQNRSTAASPSCTSPAGSASAFILNDQRREHLYNSGFRTFADPPQPYANLSGGLGAPARNGSAVGSSGPSRPTVRYFPEATTQRAHRRPEMSANNGGSSRTASDRVSDGRVGKAVPKAKTGAPKGNLRWTTAEDERLVQMRRQGITHQVISEELGKTSLACRLKWFQLNKRDNARNHRALSRAPRAPRAARVRRSRSAASSNATVASSASPQFLTQDADAVRTFTHERRLLPAAASNDVSEIRQFPAVNIFTEVRRPSTASGVAPDEQVERLRNDFQAFLAQTAQQMQLSPNEVQHYLTASQGGDGLRSVMATTESHQLQVGEAGPSNYRTQPATQGGLSQIETDVATSLSEMASRSRTSSDTAIPQVPGFASLSNDSATGHAMQEAAHSRPLVLLPAPRQPAQSIAPVDLQASISDTMVRTPSDPTESHATVGQAPNNSATIPFLHQLNHSRARVGQAPSSDSRMSSPPTMEESKRRRDTRAQMGFDRMCN